MTEEEKDKILSDAWRDEAKFALQAVANASESAGSQTA